MTIERCDRTDRAWRSRGRGRAARLWLVGVLLGLAFAPARLPAEPLAVGADELKAAYLFKFVSYVDWPDSAFAGAGSPLVIGVVGADAVYDELARVIVGRSAHGRAVVARKVAVGDAIEDVQVLFVGDPAAATSPWIQRQRDRPVLIVTDTPRGLEVGASLNFVRAADRLRFEASLRAFDRAGLKVSSRLLALAQHVVPAP